MDYSNLNGYYGAWSKYVSQNTSDIQVKCFSKAILQLINYLNGKSVSYSSFISVDTTKFHPILKGRIFSIKILSGNFNSNDIEKYFNSLKIINDKKNISDYFYELTIIAIFSRNFLLMELIINFLSNQQFSAKYYYQEHHLKLYKLMCLFYFNSKDDDIPNKDELINNSLESEFKYSYKEIIQILIIVFNYHKDKKENEIHLKEFEKVSKKINYSLFSKDYLMNYFT